MNGWKDCRLYGGPYDGDEAEMREPLPQQVWAYECGNPACDVGGLHWLLHPDPRVPTEVYKLGPDTGLVRLYVWADLELEEGPVAREKQLVPA